MNKFVVFTALVACLAPATLAAPAKAPVATASIVSIAPDARVVFARASALYKIAPLGGSLKALRVVWNTNERGL